jgi:hypothetical protein
MAANVHAGLDHLYTQVLSTVPRNHTFEQVIGTIMLLREPFSITSLGYLLHIEAINILLALIGIQSILMIPGDDDEPVRLFHTSLRDFMTTQSRSGDYFVDPAAGHLLIAIDCLRLLTVPPKDIIFEGEVETYACKNWCSHVNEALIGGGPNLLDSPSGGSLVSYLIDLLSGHFDCWVNTVIFHDLRGRTTLDVLESVVSTLSVSPVVPLFCGL